MHPEIDQKKTMMMPGRASILRLVARSLDIVLLSVIAVLAAKLFWLMLYGSQTPDLPERSSSMAFSFNNSLQIDKNLLSDFDPFYRTKQNNDTAGMIAEQVEENAPETNLQLKLHGTRTLVSKAVSPKGNKLAVSAIIENSSGAQQTYYLGDKILDNVSLVAVFANYVIISRGSEKEKLSLDETPDLIIRGTQPSRNFQNIEDFINRGRDFVVNQRVDQDADSDDDVEEDYEDEDYEDEDYDEEEVSQDEDDSSQDSSSSQSGDEDAGTTTNPDAARTSINEIELKSLFSSINIVPQINGRIVEGWILNPIGPASLFQSFGFREGDLLKKINEEELASSKKILEAFDNLEGLNSVSFVIERDGVERRLDFRFDG